ncbi:hypothetical protein K493DRAFT_33861 [Basidiobolus meristosporus CBS 931.73]|uniref:Uncharacterized protein n=1 Tax=Basidiobolus meristosporus CBS 931.73 TaxID=1314790 RepID=A0A1Y1Y8D5_9FUNG|nr:hypothetical protein K493DRAFT_33861 [Basidiobolus meristosporus CBS 931.73]|eukprot:ORX93834.1 hypothetical protein K493DRAFT_33861 [Basidiobolus meristosporus CBS 931.73]
MEEHSLDSYKKCLLRMYVQNPVLMGELLKSNPGFDWSQGRLDLNAVFTEGVESFEELEERLPEYLARISRSYGFHELYFRIYTWLHQASDAAERVDISRHAGHLIFNQTTRELLVSPSKTPFLESFLPKVTFSPPVLRVRVTSDSSNHEALGSLGTLEGRMGGVVDFGNMNSVLNKLSRLVDFQNTGHSLDTILQGALRWARSAPESPSHVSGLMETVLRSSLEKVTQERQG